MKPKTAGEIAKVLTDYRDANFASLILVTVQLCAERHPDELRHALAQVFDTKALEHLAKVAARHNAEARTEAERVRARLERLGRDLERLEARLDALLAAVEKWEGAA